MNKDKKRKILGFIFGVIFYMFLITSLTFAYYTWKSNNTDVNMRLHDGGLKFVYKDNALLEGANLSPITNYNNNDYYNDSNKGKYLLYSDYTAVNNKSETYKMYAKLNITSISDALKDPSFKWGLLEKEGDSYQEVIDIKGNTVKGDFSTLLMGSNNIFDNVYINPGSDPVEYRFIVYIDGNMNNSTEMMDASIKADLELCDELVPVIQINLDNKDATTAGTKVIYLRYGDAIYLDEALTKKMTTSSNPIIKPIRAYTITYDAMGGSVTTTDANTKASYAFGGYNDASTQMINATGNITSNFTNTKYTTDKTLSAQWSSGGTVTLPTPTRVGYTFDNWYKETGYTNKVSNTTVYTANQTLYAKWKANTYTISYNYNGGNKGTFAPLSGTYDSDVRISNPIKSITVTGDANGTGATVGNATSKAQTFVGWTSTTADGLGSNAKTGTAENPTTAWTGTSTKNTYFRNLRDTSGTVTLTATWTPVSVALPTVTKDGYTCKWNTKADGSGTDYNSGASYTPSATSTANITMYAICIVNPTVTFDANGGVDTNATVYRYDYTGSEQVFTSSEAGYYTLETWGASGGETKGFIGGYGGYSRGNISLKVNDKLYINVGGKGDVSSTGKIAGGYNGGGIGSGGLCNSNTRYGASGGGATHIAIKSGILSTLSSSTNDILIVSGGGSGAHYLNAAYGSGASAGGYEGNNATWNNITHGYYLQAGGGSQTSGGSGGASYSETRANSGIFGQGGNYEAGECDNGSGGGSGFYGGGAGQFSPGGGGSGYIGNSKLISKEMYCYNCQESNATSTKTISTIRKSETAASHSAKIGNGYAKITKLFTKKVSYNNPYGTLPTPTREGYVFDGWYTELSGGEKITSDSIVPSESRILYAHWTAKPKITYDINYYSNDIYSSQSTIDSSNYYSAGTAPISKSTVSDSGVEGGSYVKFVMPDGTDGGPFYSPAARLSTGTTYTWSVYIKASSPKTLTIGSEQLGTKKVNVTTSWQKITHTFTVPEEDTTYYAFIFYLNGDTWSSGDELYVHSLEMMKGTPNLTTESKLAGTPLGDLSTPSRTGYTFNGWWTEPAGGTQISSSTNVPEADTTYYAHWTINYWYFDVNPESGMKFDITILGQTLRGQSDYYVQVPYGTEATITGVVPATGYNYSSYSVSGSMSTMSGSSNNSIKLKLGEGGGAVALSQTRTGINCGAKGGDSTYAGKTWYTVDKDSNYCYLALKSLSGSTGTYSEATTKLTNEYFTSGSTLLNEKNAGLTTVQGTYTGTEQLGESDNAMWTGDGSATMLQSVMRYKLTSSSMYFGGAIKGDCADVNPKPLDTGVATDYSNYSCNWIDGSNCVIQNRWYSSNTISDHYSYRLTSFYGLEGSSTSFKVGHDNWTGSGWNYYSFSQYKLYVWACGGPRDGNLIYRFIAKNSNSVNFHNYQTNTDATPAIFSNNTCYYVAGVATSTTATVSNKVERYYNPSAASNSYASANSYCISPTIYTLSNDYKPIHYRLYIRVKYT